MASQLPQLTRRSWALNTTSVPELAQAVQNAQGTTAQFQATLGITQVQYGTFTFAGSLTVAVTFAAPFPDANYVLMMFPSIVPTNILKNAAGFAIAIADNAPGLPVDWVAIR